MNKIVYITGSQEQNFLFSLQQKKDVFFVRIDGKNIPTLSNYLKEISEKFAFPMPCKTLDGYMDWIRDLSWITQDDIIIFIDNFSLFLSKDLEKRQEILCLFKREILPWWDEQVRSYVIEGKRRNFTVFLVDNKN